MERKTQKTPHFSATHAAHALHVLIAEGKLAGRDVIAALKRREAMIRELHGKLATLEGRVVSAVPQGRRTAARKAGRKKPKLSAATRAKYRKQGHYLAAVRPLSKANRAKVKAIREKSGVRVAVAAAKRMAK